MFGITAAVIGSALIGAASQEYQRRKREEKMEELRKEREKEQERQEEMRANKKAIMGRSDLKSETGQASAKSAGVSSLRIPSTSAGSSGLNV